MRLLKLQTAVAVVMLVTVAFGESWLPKIRVDGEILGFSIPYKARVTMSGYDKVGTLTNFPLLLVLNSSNIKGFKHTQFADAGGYDLRITNGDGELNYEIERLNLDGSAYIHVQLPKLSSSTQWVDLAWGTSDKQQEYTTNGTVWETNFVFVTHCDDTNLLDSSTFAWATTNGTAVQTNGMVGNALTFDGTAGNGSKAPTNIHHHFIAKDDCTWSVWAYRAQPSSGEQFAFDCNQGGRFRHENSVTTVSWIVGNGVIDYSVADSNLVVGVWNHWVGVSMRTGANGRFIYQNGVLVASTNVSSQIGVGPANFLGIGMDKGGNLEWNGMLDELRASTIVRSSNWIWATYMSQASNTTLLTYGPAQKQ